MIMTRTNLSPWKKHKEKWSACQECDLCGRRNKVVLARGKLPCDILFIGEAPGVSEDVLGKPFVGPAGKLLDDIIEGAIPFSMKLAFTNLVACIPKGEDGVKVHEPPEESIRACFDRLEEIIKIAKPHAIVCVGKLAAKWIPSQFGFWDAEYFTEIIHPAAILRLDLSQKGLAIQRTEQVLAKVAESIVPF